MTTRSLALTAPIPTPADYPCDCQLSERIGCWLRQERELDEQFRLARAVQSVDADVLAHDLRSAGQAIDRLLLVARTEARR
jgi:hypothetical protein